MTPRTDSASPPPVSQEMEPEAISPPDLEPQTTVTRQQEMEALRRVQAQAEQRVQLGLKLFRAAETQVFSYQHLLDRVKSHQQELRQRVKQDMAESLRTYDARVDGVEDKVTSTLAELEQRMSQLNQDWHEARERLEGMMRRTESLMEHSRSLLERAEERLSRWPRSNRNGQEPLSASPQNLPLELLNPLAPPMAGDREESQEPAAEEAPAMLEPQVVSGSIANIMDMVKRRTQTLMANGSPTPAAPPVAASPLREPRRPVTMPMPHRAAVEVPVEEPANAADIPADEEPDDADAARSALYRRVLEQLQARRSANASNKG